MWSPGAAFFSGKMGTFLFSEGSVFFFVQQIDISSGIEDNWTKREIVGRKAFLLNCVFRNSIFMTLN